MANSLTDLAADIYVARDKVSRELVGAIPSVMLNMNNNDGSVRAALNDTVRSHVTRSVSTVSITPSMTIPEGTDQTVDNKTLTLSKFKGVQIPWTGEDIKHVNNGSGFQTIYGDQILQAFRAITNEMETDVCTAAYVAASRAYGTPGTTPFATAGDYTDMTETLKIVKDNGQMSIGNMSLVLNTAAGAKHLGKQADVNRQGADDIIRRGVLLDHAGVMMRESAQIQAHTKGTGSGYLVNDAALAIGDTIIAADTGTGTILAGDVVTFAGDTNKYVVTSALSGGSFTIAAPGLLAAVADNSAITVGNSYAANFLLSRSSFELAMRAPALPTFNDGKDARVDGMMVQDPISGLVFDIGVYSGYFKAMIVVSAVWGYKAWKPEGIALLQG